MSDGGGEQDAGCQVCAQGIDLADKEFRPCKCGFQICVWCWHRIVNMAEKDTSKGKCPACRQPYEKERIAMIQAIGERSASEAFNSKTKQPKAKRKANEVKDLTKIRVIQRKIAYVTGLPLSLADEDVLPRKDNFGQYGKVTKVSLSRTTGGVIQQFSNDTCSVYITYAKEEEALRCIHAVHNFVLDGRILRASFGTKTYCHAWLKHGACNYPACLYLHSIGPDEDSFGKDEDAAEYTRRRVQQIAGAGNNVMPHSGIVLPPPIDDVHIRSSTFSDKPTARSSISDGAHGSGVGTSYMHPSKDKEGPIALPRKMLSSIVGKSSSAASEKDGTNPEDRRIPDLCSELSSPAVGGEKHEEAPYSFIHPFFTPHVSQDWGGLALERKTPSMTGFTPDHCPVNDQDELDSCQETKFQDSAKSDRTYSSRSFSNEEIVEHLRRIDNDNLHNDDDDSVLDAVERSIISNILPRDFDSCGDPLAMVNGLSELLGEADRVHSVSWSSQNNEQLGYRFPDGEMGEVFASRLVQRGHTKETYLYELQCRANWAQSLAPPRFSMPYRDPPLGFWIPSSGGEHSDFLTSPLPLGAIQGSSSGDANFNNPANLRSSGQGNQTNGFQNTMFEAKPYATPELNLLEDESRFWLLMKQSASPCQDSNLSKIFAQQLPLLNRQGLAPSLCNENQSREPSFFTQMAKEEYANGSVQQEDESWLEEHRNEILGVKYFSGLGSFGDLIPLVKLCSLGI